MFLGSLYEDVAGGKRNRTGIRVGEWERPAIVEYHSFDEVLVYMESTKRKVVGWNLQRIRLFWRWQQQQKFLSNEQDAVWHNNSVSSI